MKPDATIRIRFLTTEEGGRLGPIEGSRYGCPLMVDDQGFDCRFVLDGTARFEPGQTYVIGVKLLNPDSVLPELKPGKPVSLWEGKIIGIGDVVSLHADHP